MSAMNAIGAAVVGLLGANAALAGIVTVDDFTSGAFSDSQSAVGNYYAQQAGSMMGGQRDLRYAVVANQFGLSSDVVIGGGMVFNSNDPGVKGAIALDYDGVGDVEVNGNADFVRGPGLNGNWTGTPSVDIDFLFLDLNFEVRVVLQTYGAGTTVAGETTITDTVNASGAAFLKSFNLASGIATVGAGVDLTNVDRLAIYFNNNAVAAVDFGISRISVPTPGAMSILALGGLATIRRRR